MSPRVIFLPSLPSSLLFRDTARICENVINYNRARANYQSRSYWDNDYQKYDGHGILHGTLEINHARRITMYYDIYVATDVFRTAEGFNKSPNLRYAVDKRQNILS